jgi:hypothetical protein
MSAPESERHRRLKRLATEWARANGFPVCACEVRVPRSAYRADVAAGGHDVEAATALFECKQARADLLKDAHAEAAARAELAALVERRQRLEALLALHRPDLRRGEALWPEFDIWDFSGLEHRAYRSVLADLDLLRRRVRSGTKFSRLHRYQSADVLYLVVEDNIYAEAEIPAGWGLLVRAGEGLRLARAPARLTPTAEQRRALLERIAAVGRQYAARGGRTDAPVSPRGVGPT